MYQLTMTQKYLISQVSKLTPELIDVLREDNDYDGLINDTCRLFNDLKSLNGILGILRRNNCSKYFYFDLENYLKDWR